jgi:hypothetical protein
MMDNTTPHGRSLCEDTMAALRAYFVAHEHRPSDAHWAALEDVAETLEAMADGRCPPKILLSSCDPGVGKSQTVVHFARALVRDEARDDVGMVVCVGRIEEAKTLAAELALPTECFTVLTSDEEANSLGSADAANAQVLITTQQRVERHTRGRSFDTATEFHYRGQSRRCRVWDETWLPGTAISLNRDDLAALFKPLRARFPALTDSIEDLFAKLRTVGDGEALPIPDFAHEHGVALNDLLGAVDACRDDQRIAVTSLFVLSGRTARVRHDGPTGNAMLTYEDTLPADLAPLLVLDASGRVRHTYADVEKHRGNLCRLRTAIKDYTPLTVHVWHTAGSKSGWQRRGPELIDGIVKTILTKPTERWLVVHHKATRGLPDVEREVCLQLSDVAAANVSFITWGRHMATNDYADVPNVILAGTLFMRPSFYTALTHLAQGKPVDRHMMPADDIRQTIEGEYRNLLLQAICRGRVRKLNGDQCLPMNAYVIAAPISGIPAALPSIFPGCTVRRWDPLGFKLTGHAKAAIEYVQAVFASGTHWLTYPSIAEHLGIDRRNFGRDVSKRPEWVDAVASIGAEITRGKRCILGVRLLPDAAIAD